jgi:hypothetical protein
MNLRRQIELRALDLAMAEKVMGWTPWDGRNVYAGPLGVTAFCEFDDGGQIIIYRETHDTGNPYWPSNNSQRWSPAQKIDDAFEIVEHMRSKGLRVVMFGEKNNWTVQIDGPLAEREKFVIELETAETLPEAICLTARKVFTESTVDA